MSIKRTRLKRRVKLLNNEIIENGITDYNILDIKKGLSKMIEYIDNFENEVREFFEKNNYFIE